MTVASDITGQGILTGVGTQDTLRTATATEYHNVTFINYSAGDVGVEVWVNGVADQNRIFGPSIVLGAGEFMVGRIKLGNGDTIRAEASAATAIAWTDEMDILT